MRARDCEHDFAEGVTTFVNSRGVRQSERRAGFSVGVGFVAKDGARSTSMNWSGLSSAAPIGFSVLVIANRE